MTAAHWVQLTIAVLSFLGVVFGAAAFWRWWSERDERAVGTMQDVLATVRDDLAAVRAELAAERAARERDKHDCTQQLADLYRQLYAAQHRADQHQVRLAAWTVEGDSGRTRPPVEP